jgi:hypothetical protein
MTDPGPDAEFEPFLTEDDVTPEKLAAYRRDAEVATAVQRAYQRGYEDGRNAETGWRGSVQEQALRRPDSAPEFADKQYERLMETTAVGGASSIDWSPGGALYEEARQNALARLRTRIETCEDCLNGIKHTHYDNGSGDWKGGPIG